MYIQFSLVNHSWRMLLNLRLRDLYKQKGNIYFITLTVIK